MARNRLVGSCAIFKYVSGRIIVCYPNKTFIAMAGSDQAGAFLSQLQQMINMLLQACNCQANQAKLSLQGKHHLRIHVNAV